MQKWISSSWHDKYFWRCAAICTLIALFPFVYFIIDGNGILTITRDYIAQQVPFGIGLHNSLFKGGFSGWTWNLDLGVSTIQGFSFYNLGSPFFWISLFFSADKIPYLYGFLFIAKYVVAGLTSFIYLRRFVKDPNFAILGSTLYAFSGFQATNIMFFHFHDVVAFFPLMLIGLEKILDDDKNIKLFIFAVFINALINYFFFVQEVVFIVLYFFFRISNSTWREKARKLTIITFSALLGLGMSAVLFVPNILYILGNPRSTSSLFNLGNMVVSIRSAVSLVKGYLFPGEPMHDGSIVFLKNWSSTSAYLPMIGVSLVIAYLMKNRDWLSKLLITLCVISFSPLLSSVFLFFTASYQRWWFMLVLIMVLASIHVIENKTDFNIPKAIVINSIIVMTFYICIFVLKILGNQKLPIFHDLRFLGMVIISLAGVVLTWLLTSTNPVKIRTIILFTSIFSIGTTSATLYLYHKDTDPKKYSQLLQLYSNLEIFDPQYRYNTSDNLETNSGNVAGLSGFSSTVSNSVWSFDALFDYSSGNLRMDKNMVPGLVELLGGKYLLTADESMGKVVKEFESEGINYYIVEQNTCPIGYSVHNYILSTDLRSISIEERGVALLSAAVINPDDENLVSILTQKKTKESIDFSKSVDSYTIENASRGVKKFQRDNSGFSFSTDYVEDTLVYFSVPNDSGWTAFIDGTSGPIIDSGGMMLIRIPKGDHSVHFLYLTPGVTLGKWISIATFLIYFSVLVFRRKQETLVSSSN